MTERCCPKECRLTLPGPEEEGEPDNPEPDDTEQPCHCRLPSHQRYRRRWAETLTARHLEHRRRRTAWTDVSYSYQWVRRMTGPMTPT